MKPMKQYFSGHRHIPFVIWSLAMHWLPKKKWPVTGAKSHSAQLPNSDGPDAYALQYLVMTANSWLAIRNACAKSREVC